MDESAEPAKACRGCNYYDGASGAACGRCSVLHGAVSARGHCVSWTAKTQGNEQR
ncbi:MAG: high-potential iron-sulfur protein [Steroidobacter sp.]